MTTDYESLKDIAKLLQRTGYTVGVKDLLALAPQNDPFYVGSASQRRDGEWFAEVYNKVGGTHLRRVHYRILDLPESERTLPTVLTAKVENKELTFTHYANYERCWDWLTNAAKYARYLGLVAIDAFTDNRAKEDTFKLLAHWPALGDYDFDDPTPRYDTSGYWDSSGYDLPGLPELPDLPRLLPDLPDFYVDGYEGVQQGYHIEIWVEKSEGEDVILPLCRKYNVNFVPGVGDMSITTTYNFCKRVKRAGRPARLLYISDFDPSGYNMPAAVARKIEHMATAAGFADLDITLEPILLTPGQVVTYNLPPAPVKDSDARKDKWELEYGGAVELNAMFARDDRIAAAQRIIEQAVLKYYDPDLRRRAFRQKGALTAALGSERDDIIDDYRPEISELQADYTKLLESWEQARQEFEALIQPFTQRLETFREDLEDINRRGDELYTKLLDDLGAVDIDAEDEYPLPEPAEADRAGVLYDSQRTYWQQLAEYHAYKLNGNKSTNGWLAYLVEMSDGA